MNGGLPGARSRKTLLRKEGSQELLPSKIDRVKVRNGDLLVAETWGGGGCGDPLERDPEKVVFDVDAGLVTPEGAKRYGVVLDSKGKPDHPATQALRREMAAVRGPTQLFDRGFKSIDELKARCLSETGLQPPQQPTFSTWTLKSAGITSV